MMDTTSMSYVIPAAHCDLDLNLGQRGMLNAITYLAIIIVWVMAHFRREMLKIQIDLLDNLGSHSLLKDLCKPADLKRNLLLRSRIVSQILDDEWKSAILSSAWKQSVQTGMISGALIWGFLSDTLGRKKILITGYLLDAICVVIAGLSQSYEMLLTAKFFTGLIMTGPFAALTTTVSEFHCAKYRGKVVLVLGGVYSFGQLIIPALGWLIIPRNMDYDLFDGNMKLHSWNFFILICSIPSLIAFVGHCFLPESPKFLMTVGRNEQALRTFKKVYSLNTGRDPDSFQIKSLIDETKLNKGGKHGGLVTANRTKIQALKEGWQQIAPMFFPPYLWKITLAAAIQCALMLGTNTIRLWLPQIFTAINDYQLLHPGVTDSLCKMLEIITPDVGNTTKGKECVVNAVSDFVYINAMIVAGTSILAASAISVSINILGKKRALLTLSGTSAITAICFYFAQNSATVVALSAITVTFLNTSLNIELAIVVDMFPTTLRTIAVAITLMIGRIGAMSGNVVFPYLLAIGCLPPFVVIGCIILTGSAMSLILPKTDLKAMK